MYHRCGIITSQPRDVGTYLVDLGWYLGVSETGARAGHLDGIGTELMLMLLLLMLLLLQLMLMLLLLVLLLVLLLSLLLVLMLLLLMLMLLQLMLVISTPRFMTSCL